MLLAVSVTLEARIEGTVGGLGIGAPEDFHKSVSVGTIDLYPLDYPHPDLKFKPRPNE